jgi:hypothetical protein
LSFLENSKKKMIWFSLSQKSELGAVYALLSKVTYLLAKTMDFSHLFVDFAKSTIPWTTPDGKVATQNI